VSAGCGGFRSPHPLLIRKDRSNMAPERLLVIVILVVILVALLFWLL
jgi:hypothetical protein